MNQIEIEALSAVVEDMEQDATKMDADADYFVARDLRGYARQISTIIKMSRPAEQIKYVPPEVQHRIEIDKARAEFRNADGASSMRHTDFMPKAIAEEEEPGFVTVRGGPNHGMSVPALPASAPVGAHTQFAGEIYTLAADRNFDYNEEETLKMRKVKPPNRN